MTKIVDLSKTIKNYADDPFYMKVKIKNKSHRTSRILIKHFLKLPRAFFPKSFVGWADDTITKMGVHSTTHVDAPWHYSPTVNGKKAKTIDEMPLELCYGEGALLDFSDFDDFHEVTIDDVKREIEKCDIEIKEGVIVLIRTGRDTYIGTKEYPDRGIGMGAQATEYLIDRGVKVMGIDQWGWDLPLKYAAAKAKESGDNEFFWQGHLVGARKEYYHMEQLVNLQDLPRSGFKVALFPLKIEGASAGPARVVAIFE